MLVEERCEREWLKVSEVARLLDLSKPRVYQMIREGALPGVYKTGTRSLRVDRTEFFAWLEKRRL